MMKNKEQAVIEEEESYEQLRFSDVINTVCSENYPVSFPKHWHKDIEIIAIPEENSEASCGMIQINNEVYKLAPGDILMIWPGELHEVIDNSKKSMVALQFPLSILTERREFAFYMNTFKSQHFIGFEEDPELSQNMHFCMHQIFAIGDERDKQFRMVKMVICLYELFMAWADKLSQIHNEPKNMLDDASLFSKIQLACRYIEENCIYHITLEKVAEYIGFSPCYFSRTFKKTTHYSFIEYLTMQRVRKLQVLLMENDIAITDAAYQVGFKSISTLNRVFKQYSGCSPSEYKKYYKR